MNLYQSMYRSMEIDYYRAIFHLRKRNCHWEELSWENQDDAMNKLDDKNSSHMLIIIDQTIELPIHECNSHIDSIWNEKDCFPSRIVRKRKEEIRTDDWIWFRQVFISLFEDSHLNFSNKWNWCIDKRIIAFLNINKRTRWICRLCVFYQTFEEKKKKRAIWRLSLSMLVCQQNYCMFWI